MLFCVCQRLFAIKWKQPKYIVKILCTYYIVLLSSSYHAAEVINNSTEH